MPVLWIFLIVLGLAAVGFIIGRSRSLSKADGDIRKLHSLPNYYGWSVVLFTLVPSLLVLGAWLIATPVVIENQVAKLIPERIAEDDNTRGLVMADVRRVAGGLSVAIERGVMTREEARDIRSEFTDVRARLAEVGVAVGENVGPEVLLAAKRYRTLAAGASTVRSIVVIALAILGFLYALSRISPTFRARNVVERVIKTLLILCATIAILTTVGIVFSMLFETRNFFQEYDWKHFFFDTTWSPNFRGNSDLGIIPLLWGTLYISFIALLVSVPIGLFAAIYMSEYAGPKFRSVAKPAIEILAGIPTIVYGLFALITVGPMLRDYFAQPMGLGDSSSSVMTAGLVMGIMLIPFVSSLSDDIINAVPQTMRDGSLGLGATQSETIRQVVLPAALPGVVGAILLAASRAIGETMIVVLGAGAAARLDLNPFEAMTTVTVKIVSQLTGDTDFNSPETLVAFALGLTLFVMTLGLNVLALWIVRRYREQYE